MSPPPRAPAAHQDLKSARHPPQSTHRLPRHATTPASLRPSSSILLPHRLMSHLIPSNRNMPWDSRVPCLLMPATITHQNRITLAIRLLRHPDLNHNRHLLVVSRQRRPWTRSDRAARPTTTVSRCRRLTLPPSTLTNGLSNLAPACLVRLVNGRGTP
jgi:hypothetical protein